MSTVSWRNRLLHLVTGPNLGLLLTVALAAYLRLHDLYLVQFKADEARALALATTIVKGQGLPLAGIPSSVGLDNPPLLPYLISIPLLLSRDAMVATAFVAILNVAAVGITFILVRRYFNTAAATIAALLFAVGFWPVTFSRFLWAQNFLPFFSALAVLCLYEAVVKSRRWLFVLSALLVGLMIQLHFSALSYLPVLVLVAIIFRKRLGFAPIAGLAVIGLVSLPFVLRDMTLGMANLHRLLGMTGAPAALDLKHWFYPAQIIGNLAHHPWFGTLADQVDAIAPNVDWSSWGEGALLLLGVLYSIVRVGRGFLIRSKRSDAVTYGLLATWLMVPLLFFSRSSYPVYEHYFIGLYPVIFALTGIAAGDLIVWLGSKVRHSSGAGMWRNGPAIAGIAIVSLVIGAIALAQAGFVAAAIPYNARGIALGDLQKATSQAAAIAKSEGTVRSFIISEGWVAELLDPLGRLRLDARTLSDGHTIVFAGTDERAIYLTMATDGPAAKFLKYDLTDSKIGQTRDGRGQVLAELFSADGQRIDAVARNSFAPVNLRLDNDIEILGVSVQPAARRGDTVSIGLYWSVASATAKDLLGKDYRFFLHITPSPEALQIAQRDDIGYPTTYWAAGDRVLNWFDILIPPQAAPGDYFLRVGMYDLATNRRSQSLNPGNQANSDSFIVGRIRIDQ